MHARLEIISDIITTVVELLPSITVNYFVGYFEQFYWSRFVIVFTESPK